MDNKKKPPKQPQKQGWRTTRFFMPKSLHLKQTKPLNASERMPLMEARAALTQKTLDEAAIGGKRDKDGFYPWDQLMDETYFAFFCFSVYFRQIVLQGLDESEAIPATYWYVQEELLRHDIVEAFARGDERVLELRKEDMRKVFREEDPDTSNYYRLRKKFDWDERIAIYKDYLKSIDTHFTYSSHELDRLKRIKVMRESIGEVLIQGFSLVKKGTELLEEDLSRTRAKQMKDKDYILKTDDHRVFASMASLAKTSATFNDQWAFISGMEELMVRLEGTDKAHLLGGTDDTMKRIEEIEVEVSLD